MDARQGRCGLPNCQWCGRKKILIDRHDIAPAGLYDRMPPTAVFLCPLCDEADSHHRAGPLATIIACVAASHIEARRTKESDL